ncbi:MAG: hypothetical protein OXF72_07155 [Gammaproteobacteria bacterium]|nr:hypothetical protein [Gammaproteobacteria bacterium]MCY4278823.1 hypothetical protein [Gammaproteobacteria bacterium]
MAVTEKNPLNLLDVVSDAWDMKDRPVNPVKCGMKCKASCLCKGLVENASPPMPAKLSRMWVCALARRFQEHYRRPQHRVFWKDNEQNKTHFSPKELLFDIVVCSTDTTRSLESVPRELEFVSTCHWQIECEFKKNSRDVILDMSKLVMGSAKSKLMIASYRDSGEELILKQCAPIAASCTGKVYFCFVAHPEEWKKPKGPSLHMWTREGWKPMDVQIPSV